MLTNLFWSSLKHVKKIEFINNVEIVLSFNIN